MPRYTVWVNASGWFEIVAENDDDAANAAAALTQYGSAREVEEWMDCEVSNIEREGDDASA